MAGIHTEGDAVEFELVDADGGDYFIVNRASGERLGYTGSTLFWAPSTVADATVQWSVTDSTDGWDYLNHAGTWERLRGTPLGMVPAATTGVEVQWAFVRSASSNEMDPYHTWTLGYGLSGSAAARTNDLDGDGLENVYEFALGGSPIDGHDTSHPQP